MKQMIAAVAVFCAVNAAAQADFKLPSQAGEFSKQIAAQKAQSQAAAFSAHQSKKDSHFPMIAERMTPIANRGGAAQGKDCDGRTSDGIATGCAIPVTPTGETTEDGIPTVSIPLGPNVPYYGAPGTVELSFNLIGDPAIVRAKYELCAVVGPNDYTTVCSEIEFFFPELDYVPADGTIRYGDEIVAKFRDAQWYRNLKGWVMANGFQLVYKWEKSATPGAEPELVVTLVRS